MLNQTILGWINVIWPASQKKKRDLLTPSNETASGGSAGNFKENCLSSYTPHGCFFLWLSSRRPHLCPDEFTCYQLKNKCAKFILFTAFWRWEGGGGGVAGWGHSKGPRILKIKTTFTLERYYVSRWDQEKLLLSYSEIAG